MSTLLLLSLLLFPAGSSGLQTKNAGPKVPPSSAAVAVQPVAEASESASNFDHIQINDGLSADHICLKIRAFIFETNDDRVPKFVRETTCMPVNGGVKKVNGTKPRLVPATEGQQF